MKINRLIDITPAPARKRMFLESVRFGERERQMARMLPAKVGIEFEFHLFQERLLEQAKFKDIPIDDLFDASPAIDSARDDEGRRIVTRLAQKLEELVRIISRAQRFLEIHSVYNDPDPRITAEIVSEFLARKLPAFLGIHLPKIKQALSSIFLIFKETEAPVENAGEFESWLSGTLPELEVFWDNANTVYTIDNMEINGVFIKFGNAIEELIGMNTGLRDALGDEGLLLERLEFFWDKFDAFRDDVENEIFTLIDVYVVPASLGGYPTDHMDIDFDSLEANIEGRMAIDLAIGYVSRTLPEHVGPGVIRDVVDDLSVSDGAEAITVPLPFDRAVEVIYRVCDYIRQNGYTSEKTGVHLNISLEKGMTLEDIDPLRFMLLMDSSWITRQYVPRQYVDSLDSFFIGRHVNAVREYLTNGLEGLEAITRGYLPVSVKYQQLNFMNVWGTEDPSEARIEYRAPGGEDYEEDPERIIAELERSLFMLNAAINSESFYSRDQMLKDLFKFWNRITLKSENNKFDFLDMMAEIDNSRSVPRLPR